MTGLSFVTRVSFFLLLTCHSLLIVKCMKTDCSYFNDLCLSSMLSNKEKWWICGCFLTPFSLSLSLSQSAMEIVNKELCPLFYMPTTSGEWQKMKNTVSEHHVVSHLCNILTHLSVCLVLGRCLPSLGGNAYNPSNIPTNFTLPGLDVNETLAEIRNATG